jgi:thiol:disulfide interchange protein DsbC
MSRIHVARSRALALLLAALLSACAHQPPAHTSAAASKPGALDAHTRQQVATALSHSFHNFHYDDLRATQVAGVYEVDTGGRVLYYAPAADVLLFGEMVGTDGKSITAERLTALQSQRANAIRIDAGTEVGDSGPQVLAFVDPDCGYCRRAHEWLKQQKLQSHIREVLFFMPLSGRPAARARAENLICAPHALKRAALDALWSPAAGTPQLTCPQAQEKLLAQAEQAKRFGVQGTPTFVIHGEVVAGFDAARLQQLLHTTPKE